MTDVVRVVRATSLKEKKDSLSSPEEASKRLEPRKIEGAKILRTCERRAGASLLPEKVSKKSKQEKGHLFLLREKASKKRGIFSCC